MMGVQLPLPAHMSETLLDKQIEQTIIDAKLRVARVLLKIGYGKGGNRTFISEVINDFSGRPPVKTSIESAEEKIKNEQP